MTILSTEKIRGFELHRVKLSENLYLDEYIPFEVYRRYMTPGDKYFGWGEKYLEVLCRKINQKLIQSDQALRNIFGYVTINNWWDSGKFNDRGVRFSGYKAGAELSDHFQGNASDKSFGCAAEEVREYIRKNWQRLNITIIEDGVSWVHTSVAWIPDQKQLKIVYP